jgi:hypothetical protein
MRREREMNDRRRQFDREHLRNVRANLFGTPVRTVQTPAIQNRRARMITSVAKVWNSLTPVERKMVVRTSAAMTKSKARRTARQLRFPDPKKSKY